MQQVAATESSTKAENGGDLLHLSGSTEPGKISAARQQNLQRLQAAYNSNMHEPDPQKIADALIRHAFHTPENK